MVEVGVEARVGSRLISEFELVLLEKLEVDPFLLGLRVLDGLLGA